MDMSDGGIENRNPEGKNKQTRVTGKAFEAGAVGSEKKIVLESNNQNVAEAVSQKSMDLAPEAASLNNLSKDSPSSQHIELGRRGEQAAATYLEKRGFYIYDRNWICKAGEADIVAEEDDILVFIEVKTRSSTDKGFPEEAVDARKRKRYETIAGYYLSEHDFVDKAVRFDVISILVVGENRAFLRHHRDAFALDY